MNDNKMMIPNEIVTKETHFFFLIDRMIFNESSRIMDKSMLLFFP